MVDELVVTERLSDEMVQAGRTLVRALDTARVPVSGAFWLYSGEAGRWQLALASSRVKRFGPSKVYEDVQAVLARITLPKKLFLSDITVMETDAALMLSLRRENKRGLIRPGTRLSRTVINGHSIEGAYIYRLKKGE